MPAPHAGPPAQSSIDVRDPRALHALAHPLRGRILGLLRLEGPSTATLLGQRLGESSGATSYHLRRLAAYGFVEDVPDEGSGRERWWRALHRSTHWETSDFLDDPAAREVVDELLLMQVDQRRRTLAAYVEQRAGLGDEWQGAASLSDYALRLRPDAARSMAEELNAVLERWRDNSADPAQPPPDTELVAVHIDVLPLTDYPL
ncbi:MAG: helix-turn-helix domain-containing protein [Actinomycetes bacterium]